jgi:flagellar FliL protein
MADAAPKPREAVATAPPKRSSFKATLAQALVITLLAAAAGAASEALRPPERTEPEKGGGAAVVAAPASNLVDLPPIVTNLAAPRDTWIRLESSIVIDAKATPHPDVIGGEIAADLLAYLRTLSLRDIEGPIGLQNVRQDLNDRAVVRSGGKVSELLIRTLVVQ